MPKCPAIGVRGDERNKTHLAIEISMFTKEGMEWGNDGYKRGELHELIGATIRLLLSSIYTRNEGKTLDGRIWDN